MATYLYCDIQTEQKLLGRIDELRRNASEETSRPPYQMSWADTRKHITFTCPNGRKCRDSSLHDETFLKENLEALFIYRQATGFRPRTLEPDEGWMSEAMNGLVRLGRSLENSADLPPLPSPPTWTDSK